MPRFVFTHTKLLVKPIKTCKLPVPFACHFSTVSSSATTRESCEKTAIYASCWKNPYPDDQFVVNDYNGFLPRQDPLVRLPKEYVSLENLLQRMSIKQPDGSPGLLEDNGFGNAVLKEFPEYDVTRVTDTRILSALYRDLTFAASAYLLEPCDVQFRKTGEYGLGRDVLPRQIAVPLSAVAQKIGARPFMEYALSYALYNYRRVDPLRPLDYKNLKLIRTFSGNQDEHGFILVHVAMVRYSNALVAACIRSLDAVETKDRKAFDSAMKDVRSIYNEIIGTLVTMWNRSAPEKYLSYRTFIMGIKNQPMFPNGIIYEGVSTERFKLRGESGANDSMIPLGDNLLELTAGHPNNPLTEVLKDFRTYRPRNHRLFLEHINYRATSLGLRKFATADANSAALYLANLDLIRSFRHHHWMMTKEYIIKRSKHPVATGGSPIVTWLPNQLISVLDTMKEVTDNIQMNRLTVDNHTLVADINHRASAEKRTLAREVAQLAKQRGRKATQVDAVETISTRTQ
ncbi:hypothetical protein BDF19DRAFT_436193 [Syncephalis fuscata]|nr:hypothetical protein BDF19DRAFT_436193 [Syncephalis fuscata]